jgi:hypothetical protein
MKPNQKELFMPGQLPIAIFAILIGAVEVAGGMQELVYRGILNSETEPMIIGALGTTTGALLLAAGIALLVGSRLAGVLVQSAAYVAVPFFLLAGVFKHYTGWPMTVVGIAYPLFLLLYCQKIAKPAQLFSKS